MRKNYTLLICLSFVALNSVFAQKDNVGIGTTKPDQSAILDLSSQNKGLLTPRMSLQQRNSITSPANGLLVYQTDFLSGFYFYDGKDWKSLGNSTNANSIAGTDGDWQILPGGSTAGATGALGTSDQQPLRFMTWGEKTGRIEPASFGGNSYLGYHSGRSAGANTNNTAFGYETMQIAASTLTGSNNSAFGNSALFSVTSGGANTAIGSGALYANTTASGNTGIGVSALQSLVANGNYNTAIGGSSLLNLNPGPGLGQYNVAIGFASLLTNVSGSENMAIGTEALRMVTGSNNTAIGTWAGRNAVGSGNFFFGNHAGENESGDNKLYIANSNTTLPLIYGDFSAKFISIGDVGVAGDPVATATKRNNLATQYGLLVQKGILTEKIKVATMTTTDWADYVFEDTYKRMSLEEVERFVKENKHLPNVPTTEQMMASGSDLIKTDAKLLEKIEELTLYMIEMNKEIKALKAENAKLKK